MAEQTYSIRYPRNRLVRTFWRIVGRVVLFFLARVKISGRANFPKKGPLIVVGNHVGNMEVILMVVYSPWQVELLGVGDIPIDPGFAPVALTFKYIPVKRGQMDRQAMNKALDVLKQGGVVGVFPEGGIWETRLKEAQSGVSWLSLHGNAPILPMGFGGMVGALNAVRQLKRPRLVMNIGRLLPALQLQPGQPRREALEAYAQQVMGEIEKLIPLQDIMRQPAPLEESFELQVQVQDQSAHGAEIPPELLPQQGEALSFFFWRPVLLDIFQRNLRRPVSVLQDLRGWLEPKAVLTAANHILSYLENENPYLLTYRFGSERAAAMQAGLQELQRLAEWAAGHDYRLKLTPIHRRRMAAEAEEIVETNPGRMHKM